MRNRKAQGIVLIMAVVTLALGFGVMLAGGLFASVVGSIGKATVSANTCDQVLGAYTGVETVVSDNDPGTCSKGGGFLGNEYWWAFGKNRGLIDCARRGAVSGALGTTETIAESQVLAACGETIEYNCPIATQIKTVDEAARCVYDKAVETFYFLRAGVENSDGDLIPYDLGLVRTQGSDSYNFYKITVNLTHPGAVNLTSINPPVGDPEHDASFSDYQEDNKGCEHYIRVDYTSPDCSSSSLDNQISCNDRIGYCEWVQGNPGYCQPSAEWTEYFREGLAYPYWCGNSGLENYGICWEEAEGKCGIRFDRLNRYTMALSLINNCQLYGPETLACKCFTKGNVGYASANGLRFFNFHDTAYGGPPNFGCYQHDGDKAACLTQTACVWEDAANNPDWCTDSVGCCNRNDFQVIFDNIPVNALYEERPGYRGCGNEIPGGYPVDLGVTSMGNVPYVYMNYYDPIGYDSVPGVPYIDIKVGEQENLYIGLINTGQEVAISQTEANPP